MDQREKRLRKEDIEILEYFDELIIGESDSEGCWRNAEEGEIDGLESESESESESDDPGDEEDEEDEEREEAEGEEGTTRRILSSIYSLEEQDGRSSEGEEGTTRRILNSIYSLEEQEGRSSDEAEEEVEEDGSQASLTVSEQAEYEALLNAWEETVE